MTITVWMRAHDGGSGETGLGQQAIVANKVGGAFLAACSVCSCTRPVVDGLGLACLVGSTRVGRHFER